MRLDFKTILNSFFFGTQKMYTIAKLINGHFHKEYKYKYFDFAFIFYINIYILYLYLYLIFAKQF